MSAWIGALQYVAIALLADARKGALPQLRPCKALKAIHTLQGLTLSVGCSLRTLRRAFVRDFCRLSLFLTAFHRYSPSRLSRTYRNVLAGLSLGRVSIFGPLTYFTCFNNFPNALQTTPESRHSSRFMRSSPPLVALLLRRSLHADEDSLNSPLCRWVSTQGYRRSRIARTAGRNRTGS